MPNDFQQTVNLREKMKKAKLASQNKRSGLASPSRSGQVDRVYNNENGENVKEDLQKINQPKVMRINEALIKRLVIFLAIILIGVTVYWLFFNKEQPEPAREIGWYMVKLINGEIYYGEINDFSANPVIIKNVYYNYDQIKGEEEEIDEASSIRLVKRGKETHGPSGTMYIYQVQIEIIDELSHDSKVLQAILEYEQ
ncbi:hypothetical protein KAU19_04245 [Candidatus Parcubacteria bacterium]|nr:hypothetical protein [Candidatus Parcubacteria bacterium]